MWGEDLNASLLIRVSNHHCHCSADPVASSMCHWPQVSIERGDKAKGGERECWVIKEKD